MKPFLTINEQIQLLENRGMIFRDKDSARYFLLRKNYYNTANVYGKYFLINPTNDNFKTNSSFDDICAMYDFEKRLRDHMFNLLMTVEANVSSTMAHLFSKKFPAENSYLDINNFCITCQKEQLHNWSFIQGRFSKIQADSMRAKASQQNSVRHHLDNHDSVPLWVIINDLTFGNIVSFFRLFDNDLKQEIAESFEELLSISYGKQVHLKTSEMQVYLDALSNLRNIVAHDSCLSIYRNNAGKHVPLNDLNKAEYVGSNVSRTKFYDVMLVARFFVSKNTHYTFIDNVLKEIVLLESRIQDRSVLPTLMEDLGFNFYT